MLHVLKHTHLHLHTQEMDTIVNTIQETWDGDVDARLSSQCVYERLATFAREFESTKDLDFSPSELDTTEMSAWAGGSYCILMYIHAYM